MLAAMLSPPTPTTQIQVHHKISECHNSHNFVVTCTLLHERVLLNQPNNNTIMPTSTKKTARAKKDVAAAAVAVAAPAAAADPKKVVKKKRKSKSKSPRLNFSTYIYRVLKEVSQRSSLH